jgi:hypothetical protein
MCAREKSEGEGGSAASAPLASPFAGVRARSPKIEHAVIKRPCSNGLRFSPATGCGKPQRASSSGEGDGGLEVLLESDVYDSGGGPEPFPDLLVDDVGGSGYNNHGNRTVLTLRLRIPYSNSFVFLFDLNRDEPFHLLLNAMGNGTLFSPKP